MKTVRIPSLFIVFHHFLNTWSVFNITGLFCFILILVGISFAKCVYKKERKNNAQT